MNMKRNILIVIAILALSSCMKDDRLNYAAPDRVGFSEINLSSGMPLYQVVDITAASGHYLLGINRSGRSLGADVKVDVAVAPELMDAYNSAHSTSFTAVPADCITASSESFTMGPKDLVRSFDLKWDGAKVRALLEAGGEEYVIPVSLKCSDSEMVSEGRDLVLVHLLPSKIEVMPIYNGATNSNLYWASYDGVTGYSSVTFLLDTPNRRDAMDVKYVIDYDYVDDYQDEYGKFYSAPPEGTAYVYKESVSMPATYTSVEAYVMIDASKMNAIHPCYVVPVRISETSLAVTVAEPSKSVFYIVIDPSL